MTDAVGRALAGRSHDVHLNPEGREQAQRLARRLDARSISAVYSSPLPRALETAAPLAAHGTEVRMCEPAMEIDFGEWTGRTLEELASDARWAAFNRARARTRAPRGESMQDVQSRIVSEIERLRDLHRGEAVVLITHADVIRAAFVSLRGRAPGSQPAIRHRSRIHDHVQFLGGRLDFDCRGERHFVVRSS